LYYWRDENHHISFQSLINLKTLWRTDELSSDSNLVRESKNASYWCKPVTLNSSSIQDQSYSTSSVARRHPYTAVPPIPSRTTPPPRFSTTNV